MSNTTDISITGPPFELDLSPVDQIYGRVYSRRILAFECAEYEIDTITSILRSALQATVNQIPYLAGSIKGALFTGRADGKAFVEKGAAHLIVKDVRHEFNFAELKARGFPASDLPHESLVPVPFIARLTEPRDVCRIQCNFIKGGLLLVVSCFHAVFDGVAITAVINLFSHHCAAYQKDRGYNRDIVLAQLSPPLDFNRSAIIQCGDTKIDQVLQHYGVTDGSPPVMPGGKIPGSVTVTKDFHLTSAAIARLKTTASSGGHSQWISSSDAVNALIWRCQVRARLGDKLVEANDTVTYKFLVDFRRLLPKPLSAGWLGNAIMLVNANTITVSDLLAPAGLSSAAQAIRGAIRELDAEFMSSFVGFLNKHNPMHVTYFLSDLETTTLETTSHRGFDHSSMNWGEAFGTYHGVYVPDSPIMLSGFTIIKPPSPRGDGWDVSVSLKDSSMALLETDEEWSAYTKEIDEPLVNGNGSHE